MARGKCGSTHSLADLDPLDSEKKTKTNLNRVLPSSCSCTFSRLFQGYKLISFHLITIYEFVKTFFFLPSYCYLIHFGIQLVRYAMNSIHIHVDLE